MSARPHLLYTAWSFPPSRAGGVYRALATVNAFAESGWEVTVLTVPRRLLEESTGTDERLEARVHPRVRVVRVDADVPAFQNDISAWPRRRARHQEIWKLSDLWRDLVRFPEPNYGRWRPSLERAAEQVHRSHPVDLAIGTANPHVDFIPGWHLERRYGVRHVMDYRDAWQLDVFSGRKLITAIPAVGRWERRMMSTATEIWFVNEAIREWHASTHPRQAARMRVVPNGFDEYEAPLAVPVRDDRASGLTFGYIGTISPKVPLVALLDGWRIARASSPELAGARLAIYGYLGHFGGADAGFAAALERARDDGVTFEGPVSKATIGETYRGLDALVLALGTGRFVTSGKVYEYLATGVPIVSVHDPSNAATEVLRSSPAWVATRSLSPSDIAEALAGAARMSASQTDGERRAAQEWARRFERRRQLAPRIAALEALVSR
ncbi:glycosyltransferase [Agromyces aurantiacus]|uniref:Glycosyltransferase n=1 Tax=Agromyces aurantiacus TaxID=165814 RepID=A0ABV9R5R1_9MICO|nr:glycosyltransferase [Agromyces aurantiacus]MBM7504158.1 glycosyltransferase involved in cell wall biosynthesis [Agromyces aurantiacus]